MFIENHPLKADGFFISSSMLKGQNHNLTQTGFRKALPLMGLICTSLLFTWWFYGPVLLHPNSFLLEDINDSIKNYYCYVWHVQNDTSFINYTGTNYPFGENHLYTDGTPLLGNFIKLLPFLKSYAIGIFNLTMLLSLTFCAVLVYKIFRLTKINEVFAVFAAFGIMVLCPQVLRYGGHFALSYGFCIPLVIYVVLRSELKEQRTFKDSVLIGLVLTGILFIHPYLGMICNSFVIFYWIIKLIVEQKKIKTLVLPFIIQAIIPITFYYVLLKVTDHHSDRVAKPYGFHFFVASIETVFISIHKPFRHLLSQLYPIKEQNGEGIAYVGITSLFCLFGLPYLFYKKRNSLKQHFLNTLFSKSYLYASLSALILLLFAMGYPFKWNMDWLLKYMPLVEQFRSPGRFAWVFYFVGTIGASIIISRYFVPKLNKTIRTIVVCVLFGLFTIEGVPYHLDVTKKVFPKNHFKEEYLNAETKQIIDFIRKYKPQAIIPLPFYHYGTDYYGMYGGEKIANATLIMSYHSAIPLMASMTPRNSLTEAEQLMQVIGNDVIRKNIKSKFTSNKPFLIIYNKEWINEGEKALLDKGKLVLETSHYIVKELSYNALFYNSSAEKIESIEKNKDRYIKQNGYLLSDSSVFVNIDFNELPNAVFTGNVNDTTSVYTFSNTELKKDTNYELSFWYWTRDRLDMNNEMVVIEKDVAGNNIIIAGKNVNDVANIQNGKVLTAVTFKTQHPENSFEVCFLGASDREKVFYMDDLMLREKAVNVYKKTYSEYYKDSVWIWNNFELMPKR